MAPRLPIPLSSTKREILQSLFEHEVQRGPAPFHDTQLRVREEFGKEGASALGSLQAAELAEVIHAGFRVKRPGLLALEGDLVDDEVARIERAVATLKEWYAKGPTVLRERAALVSASGLDDAAAGRALASIAEHGLLSNHTADESGYPASCARRDLRPHYPPRRRESMRKPRVFISFVSARLIPS